MYKMLEWTSKTDEKVYDQKLMADAIKKLAWKHLQENMVVDGGMLVDRTTGKALTHDVDYTHKFQVNFKAFIDHKTTCCKVEGLHALSGIDILNI